MPPVGMEPTVSAGERPQTARSLKLVIFVIEFVNCTVYAILLDVNTA
jgi:hypothetical protein